MLAVLLLFLVIVGGLIGFLMFREDGSNDNNSTGQTAEIEDEANLDDNSDENVPDYSIQLSDFTFTPNIISASAGETITVKLENNEGTHDFVIDELNVKSNLLSSNESQTITITLPEDSAGETYEFYCSFGNHRQMGMVGTLQVIAN